MRSRRDYAVITASYWGFTLTDGALRMSVLLHLHELGRTPFEIASMFLLYELLGVATNFIGGWVAARFGLKSTLFGGLALQIVACAMLLVDPTRLTVPWMMAAQGLSGVAKDLTKMSSKSYIKLVVPTDDRRGLMKWVAILTGSKNTLKGIGFFLGAWMLATIGFRGACLGMIGLLVTVLLVALVALPRATGKSRSRVGLGSLFSHDARLNWLAAARLFLFAARDVWFVLALPLYLATHLGWSFQGVGGFLAAWIIGYGIVQAAAPTLTRSSGGDAPDARRLGAWTTTLLVPLAALFVLLGADVAMSPTSIVVTCLAVFGIVFALNSAIHSYLVVAYAEADKVALRVGFYYTANAAGRLLGTVLSGAVFQAAGQGEAGLRAGLGVAMGFVAISAVMCLPLSRAERAVERSNEVTEGGVA